MSPREYEQLVEFLGRQFTEIDRRFDQVDGQIAELRREMLGHFDAEEDAVMYRRIASKPNWLKVLKACPVPMNDLPPRRREYFRSKL